VVCTITVLFTKYFYIFAENLMKIRIQQLKLWRKTCGSFFPFTVYIYTPVCICMYRTAIVSYVVSWLLLSKISSQITITYRKHTQVAWQAERLFNRLMRRLWNWKNIFGRNTEKTAGAKISFLFSTQCRTGLTLFNFRIVRPTVPLTCTFSRGCSYNSRLRLFYTTAFTIVRVVVINQNTSI